VLLDYFVKSDINNYSQKQCLMFCYQDQLISNCSCGDSKTYLIRDALFCSTDEELMCMNNFIKSFAKSNLNILCNSGCPEKCDTVEYILETSFSHSTNQIPTKHLLQVEELETSKKFVNAYGYYDNIDSKDFLIS
jgi:hypothetical protein